MSSMAENPILIDKEQDKENSPPTTHLTNPVSERPTQLPVLMESLRFGTRKENVPDYVYRNLFEYFLLSLLCMYFIKIYI